FFLWSAPKMERLRRTPQSHRSNIARVQLHRALQISRRFFPAPLAPLDETRQVEYPRIIPQRLAGNFQFSQSTVVIAVRPIKILRTRETRFTSIGTKARGGLKGGFR